MNAPFSPSRVCLTLFLHQETRRDILVSKTGSTDERVWLRRDEVEYVPFGDMAAVAVPEPLARERGLLP